VWGFGRVSLEEEGGKSASKKKLWEGEEKGEREKGCSEGEKRVTPGDQFGWVGTIRRGQKKKGCWRKCRAVMGKGSEKQWRVPLDPKDE